MNRNEFKETLKDLKEFVGPEWLEDERAAAGTIPDPMTTHPLVYAWQQTSKYLAGHRVPGLDTTPRQQFLHLMMFAGHVKNVKACPVVDSENRRVDMTASELYQKRLQDGVLYRSAVYELQVAGAHLRQGYSLSFIHDNSVPTPEFRGFRGHNTYFARYSSAPVVSSLVSAPNSGDAISVEQKVQLFILGVSSLQWLVSRQDSW